MCTLIFKTVLNIYIFHNEDMWGFLDLLYILYRAQSHISGPPIKTLHPHLLMFTMMNDAGRWRIWLDGLLFSFSLCAVLLVLLLSCSLPMFCPTWKVSTCSQSYCVPQVKTSSLCNIVYKLQEVSSEMQQITFGLFLWYCIWQLKSEKHYICS